MVVSWLPSVLVSRTPAVSSDLVALFDACLLSLQSTPWDLGKLAVQRCMGQESNASVVRSLLRLSRWNAFVLSRQANTASSPPLCSSKGWA